MTTSKNSLISNETDLDKILLTSYLSKTRRELLQMVLDTANERNRNLLQQLDTFRVEIYGTRNWKDLLQDKHENVIINVNVTHYQEMLSFRSGGCHQPNNSSQHRQNCTECKWDHNYKNRPSCLIRFIRNVHEHAEEKMGKHPGGVLETFLFPKGYKEKQQFVEYWMCRYPKLFHLVAAIQQNQVNWFQWSHASIPDQILEGLNNVLDFGRDKGKIIAQLECTKLCGGGRCKLKILVLDSPVISANMGKVISISDTAITVHHKFEEPLDYPITNPARMSFNIVFGLEQVNHRTLSAENVIFLPTKSENIDHITKEVQKFGVFEPVPIKWNDISEEAQKRISSRGNIYIQDQKYPASEFNLEYLEGGQLIDLLQTNRLELFKQENRHPEYVDRHFRELNSFEQMYSEDSLKVIKDSKGSGTTTLSHLFINSDNELFQIKRLSPYTKKITLLYDTSFDREYDKIKELAGNRSINLFEIRNGKLARFLRVIPERNIVEMNTNIVFISGAAGEGKSALMEHLRVTLSLPQTVVLHTFANKLLVPDNIFWPDAIRCFDLTDFEENVVKSLQIVLLIDGLDEVEATKFETALWNLYHLQHFQKLKVIVAVRSYLLDVIYEKFHRHLRATYCELRPLGTEGQVAIFTRYCKGVGESTAMQLMSTYQKYFNPTALQCRILGELYTDLRTSKTISDFVILDKLQLYQLVIERNFYWYFTEKIGFVGSKSSSPMFKHLYEEYKRAHIYLAAKYLLNFDADKLKGPLEHHNIELTAGQGLLDNVDEVSFTHRTFAEYFLDNWIYQVITGQMRLNEEFKSAFGELFGHFFVDWLDSDFLKLLLKQPWEPIYFDLPLVVLHCFDILNSSFIRQTPKILRKLIRSFRKYSPKIFEEDLRKLQSHKRYVYLRGYNGSEPELETNPYTISADLLVEWLCLDICPNMILDKFPDGFYMEDSQPKTVEDASKPLHIAGARLLYLPENSAKKEESEPVGWSLECFLVPYASEASGPRGSWVPNKKLIVLWRNPAQNPVFSLRHGATEKRAHKFQTSHPSLTFQTKKS